MKVKGNIMISIESIISKRIAVFLSLIIFIITVFFNIELNNLNFFGVSSVYAEPLQYDVTYPHVIINQVYGSGDKDGYVSHSFIELYNPTNKTIDMGVVSTV